MTSRSKKIKWFFNILTLLALGVAIFVLRKQIIDVVKDFDQVNTAVLLLMLPLQAINYHSYARMTQRLFKILGHPQKYRDMVKMQLELNFVNNVFPSGGVSGFSYFSLRMHKFGVSAGKATLVQTMKFLMLFLSFQIVLGLGLISLAISGRASNVVILVAATLSTTLFFVTLVMGFVIGSKARINGFFGFIARTINKLISIFWRSKPETINLDFVKRTFTELHENYVDLRTQWRELRLPFLYMLLANISEVATIYVVYVAFGNFVNPGAVILAYAVANIAGVISVLPGALGVYEAIMTIVLTASGIPASLSLPVTVMYRLLNMALQLIPGYYFYQKALHKD